MSDPYDLVTLAEAKGALRITTTDTLSDDKVARVITNVSRRLDRCIGPTVARPVNNERLDGGRSFIELAYGPVMSISSVVEYQSRTSVTLTEASPGVEPTEGWYGERYKPDPTLYSGVIVRRIDSWGRNFWSGAGNVVCSYTAGRVASTSTVPADIKEGALIMIRNWWRVYEQSTAGFEEFEVPQQNFPTFAIPNAVRDLLYELWQPETGFGG